LYADACLESGVPVGVEGAVLYDGALSVGQLVAGVAYAGESSGVVVAVGDAGVAAGGGGVVVGGADADVVDYLSVGEVAVGAVAGDGVDDHAGGTGAAGSVPDVVVLAGALGHAGVALVVESVVADALSLSVSVGVGEARQSADIYVEGVSG
jgi:hypothetical protein